MDKTYLNNEKLAVYEMLLTSLCQLQLSSAWGWSQPVADPDRALVDVITNCMMFGRGLIAPYVWKLREYSNRAQLNASLRPMVCTRGQFSRILQIKASCSDILGSTNSKDIFVWDAGPGSRMGNLLGNNKSKGDICVHNGHMLYHYAAAAAIWLIDSVKNMGKDYFAFVASDQVVCLSDMEKRQLKSILEVACLQDADVIFFDGPPELSVLRLRSFLSPVVPPQRNSPFSLARDREMLKQFGGAHIFQCVLLKKSLLTQLGCALEAVLKACFNGYNLDYGVYDVAVMPRLVSPKWLKKQSHSEALNVYETLCDLANKTQHIFPVSMPIKVFNVNTPNIFEQLQKRITNT
jgi:hypothetical protein